LKKPLQQTWNLENIFPGGSDSKELQQFLSQLKEEIAQFKQQVETSKTPETLE
jgi:oligoendopeptidase F